MKIRDIDTILIDSPGRKWTIVRVFTDEGLVGLGEATYWLCCMKTGRGRVGFFRV